ncbi:hypothetical protein [Leuconostoc litchii]|uniref:Uncharacterized protein n=1 Tax=Leuconostoc litchii TaxID=1981069 RepID=A0A6P2CT77_9LACO|nr:hypothetical protein [Leuconostoc litchii]TYC47449.1 hypothetical protein ESZ47_04735 [Leuconostoc litchii]
MKQLIIKKNSSAFVLMEAMFSLVLVTMCTVFEYNQVHQFNTQKKKLELQLKQAEFEKAKALEKWQLYDEK